MVLSVVESWASDWANSTVHSTHVKGYHYINKAQVTENIRADYALVLIVLSALGRKVSSPALAALLVKVVLLIVATVRLQ